jgi:hypothetical protein
MKDKILEILLNNIHPGNGMFDEAEATEQLNALMIKTCLSMMTIIDNCVRGHGDKSIHQIMEEVGFNENELTDFFKPVKNEG